MIVSNDEQGTEAWFESRLGKPSASGFGKLITRTGKPSAQAEAYINQLIFEKLSGKIPESYTSAAMERGNELEPEARENFEFINNVSVRQVGFVQNDERTYGCSPDGLLDENGGIEIKCPLGQTMVKYMRDPQELVKAYWQQIQGSMWVTGASHWYAFAYHPETAHVQVRVERDNEYITKLAEEVKAAVKTIKTEVEKRT
tara:strand:+ start:4010 stop:4609 length:600 start_codon:yes stop_codon:yes gene_type:complete